MKIKFLGTGAADWCQALEEGKELMRKRSSAIIDGVLLIDPGPDTLTALGEYCIDKSNIRYVLNTHDHDDHMDKTCLDELVKAGADFIDIKSSEEIKLGKYIVKALKANHSVACIHFLISDGKSTLFYGLDGAWLTYEEYEAITKQPVDLGVFDGTIGFVDGDYRIFEHNNLNMIIEMQKTLSRHIKRFYISHMAYTLHKSHKELSADMEKYGIGVACDGLEIEF